MGGENRSGFSWEGEGGMEDESCGGALRFAGISPVRTSLDVASAVV
jgi:hypothetical protein